MLFKRLKDLCKREGLYTHWVRFYISKSNSITEEKFLSLSYKQRKFLNTQITYELIGYDMLKLKHVLILTPWQMGCVKETGHYVLEFILKIKEVLNLTEEQLEILGHNSVYHVLEYKNTSWAELIDKKIGLHNGQLTLAEDKIIVIGLFEQNNGTFLFIAAAT